VCSSDLSIAPSPGVYVPAAGPLGVQSWPLEALLESLRWQYGVV